VKLPSRSGGVLAQHVGGDAVGVGAVLGAAGLGTLAARDEAS
jgi:hypothetical protein